jgi:hypothetical protein
MQQQQQPDNWRVTTAQSFAFTYLVARSHSLAMHLFMRHTFGVHAFDPYGVFTGIGLLVLANLYGGFGWLLGWWFLMLLYHRARLLKQERVHTRYGGYPWLAMRLPFVKDEEQARKAEPFMCGVAGLILMDPCPELGLFVGLGFFSMSAVLLIEQLSVKQRLRAMHDAEIEMQYYSDLYRRQRR